MSKSRTAKSTTTTTKTRFAKGQLITRGQFSEYIPDTHSKFGVSITRRHDDREEVEVLTWHEVFDKFYKLCDGDGEASWMIPLQHLLSLVYSEASLWHGHIARIEMTFSPDVEPER